MRKRLRANERALLVHMYTRESNFYRPAQGTTILDGGPMAETIRGLSRRRLVRCTERKLVEEPMRAYWESKYMLTPRGHRIGEQLIARNPPPTPAQITGIRAERIIIDDPVKPEPYVHTPVSEWSPWRLMWLHIGLAHALSVTKNLPPKWAAIALGYDFTDPTPDPDPEFCDCGACTRCVAPWDVPRGRLHGGCMNDRMHIMHHDLQIAEQWDAEERAGKRRRHDLSVAEWSERRDAEERADALAGTATERGHRIHQILEAYYRRAQRRGRGFQGSLYGRCSTLAIVLWASAVR